MALFVVRWLMLVSLASMTILIQIATCLTHNNLTSVMINRIHSSTYSAAACLDTNIDVALWADSTVSSWARRNFRRVATRFWCIHYRAGHHCFDLHLSVDFCWHGWIGSIWRAPHRLCQQASIPVHRSFNFFSCHAWISIYGCKVRCHTLVCTFRGSEPLILFNACVDSMVIRFEQVCISQQGLLFRSLLLCISIDTLSVSRGGAREE